MLMRPRPTFPGYTGESEVQGGEGTCPKALRDGTKTLSRSLKSQAPQTCSPPLAFRTPFSRSPTSPFCCHPPWLPQVGPPHSALDLLLPLTLHVCRLHSQPHLAFWREQDISPCPLLPTGSGHTAVPNGKNSEFPAPNPFLRLRPRPIAVAHTRILDVILDPSRCCDIYGYLPHREPMLTPPQWPNHGQVSTERNLP